MRRHLTIAIVATLTLLVTPAGVATPTISAIAPASITYSEPGGCC